MKKIIASTLFIFLVQLVNAQQYDFLEKGLKPINPKTGNRLDISLPTYLYTGEKVPQSDFMKHFADPYLKLIIFGQDQDNIKAYVFGKASEKEVQAKITRYENMPGGDFMLGKKPANFVLKDLDGKKVRLEDYRGKVVALNFWFIGCKPCVMEMPELNEIVEEFKDEDIAFLAIALDKGNNIEKFLQKTPFDYQIMPDGRSVTNRYGIFSYPTHLILNKEGEVVFSQQGYFAGLKYTLKKKIKDLLDGE